MGQGEKVKKTTKASKVTRATYEFKVLLRYVGRAKKPDKQKLKQWLTGAILASDLPNRIELSRTGRNPLIGMFDNETFVSVSCKGVKAR